LGVGGSLQMNFGPNQLVIPGDVSGNMTARVCSDVAWN